MTWKLGTLNDENKHFYLDMFLSQHIQHTPAKLISELNILDFKTHLTTLWNNSVAVHNENEKYRIYDYVDSKGKCIAFMLGIYEEPSFHIRHFCFDNIEVITDNYKKIMFEFFEQDEYINYITVRSRKGIPIYHIFLLYIGFKESDNGFFPSVYCSDTHKEYELQSVR